jgi:hypothetical protein
MVYTGREDVFGLKEQEDWPPYSSTLPLQPIHIQALLTSLLKMKAADSSETLLA